MAILTTTASVCLDGSTSAVNNPTDLAAVFPGASSRLNDDDVPSSNALEFFSFLLHFSILGLAV